jgi:hypothetical protein
MASALPDRLDDAELADWRAGRDAVYRLADGNRPSRRRLAA